MLAAINRRPHGYRADRAFETTVRVAKKDGNVTQVTPQKF
jgi:hypothetical protein